jgi:hypothetical protein
LGVTALFWGVKIRFALLICLAAEAFAQDIPKIEVFGGYSYFRLATEEGGLAGADLNGWSAAVKWNVHPRVGIVADFGGSYGQRGLDASSRPVRPGTFRQHTVLFGPEVRVLGKDRLTLHVRALIGAAYRDELVLPLVDPYQAPPSLDGVPQPTLYEYRFGPEKPVAGAVGGSVDWRISEHWRYRIFQPELVAISLGSANRRCLRASTGIVFTWGSL